MITIFEDLPLKNFKNWVGTRATNDTATLKGTQGLKVIYDRILVYADRKGKWQASIWESLELDEYIFNIFGSWLMFRD